MYNVLAAWGVMGSCIVVLSPLGIALLTWSGVAVCLGLTGGLAAYATFSLHTMTRAHQHELSLLHDCTSQRQLEHEAHVLAKDSVHLKDSFFVGVSHQVRTSLTVILGYTELLLDEGMNHPQILPDLDRIYTASKQLSTLMGDVFELTHHDANSPSPEPVEFLAQSLADELSVCFMKPCKARGNHLKIELGVEQLHLDPVMFKKLLVCLISVSNEATHNGQLVLRINADSANRRLKVEVEDDGVGLRKEQLEVLAVAGTAAREDTNKRVKLMVAGLPLMLAARLCKSLQGQLEISAVPGEGNRMCVLLPLL